MKILVRTILDDYIYEIDHESWGITVSGILGREGRKYIELNDKEGKPVAVPIKQIVSLVLIEA